MFRVNKMLTFLFWNLNKQPLATRVARLVRAHSPDVVMLAECEIEADRLVEAVNTTSGGDYAFAPGTTGKIKVFARKTVGKIVEQWCDPLGSVSIRRLDPPSSQSVLLAVMHLPSRANWSNESQAMHCVTVAQEIRKTEKDVNLSRTIVVGDLNQNPYSAGVVGAEGFNAAMTRRLIRVKQRTVQGRQFPYFFNPMWSSFGDRPPHVSGTFFHRSAPPDSHVWNIYDQVLLRPELMDKLTDLRIIESDGVESFVSSCGRPILKRSSDHLPLMFKIEI